MRKAKLMLAALAAAAALSGCAGGGQADRITNTDTAAVETTSAPSSAETTAGITIVNETAAGKAETDAEKEEASTEAGLQTTEGEAGVVSPLPSDLDLNHLDDCRVHASFAASDVKMNGGRLETTFTVYDQELFDLVDMSQLKEGDILRIDGQDVVVKSKTEERNSYVINGGPDEDGYWLWTNEDGVYYEVGYSDALVYQPVGTITLPIDENFVFRDGSDLEAGTTEAYAGDFLATMTGSDRVFSEAETEVTIAGGKVVAITVSYAP